MPRSPVPFLAHLLTSYLYSRYDRAGRRKEEGLQLTPGLHLNMLSLPTTDYIVGH